MNKFNSLDIEISNLKFYSMKDNESPRFHPFNKYSDMEINDIPSIVTKKKNSGTFLDICRIKDYCFGKNSSLSCQQQSIFLSFIRWRWNSFDCSWSRHFADCQKFNVYELHWIQKRGLCHRSSISE